MWKSFSLSGRRKIVMAACWIIIAAAFFSLARGGENNDAFKVYSPARNTEYGFYFHDQLVCYEPSERFVAIREEAPSLARRFSARSGLSRHPFSDGKYALTANKFGLYQIQAADSASAKNRVRTLLKSDDVEVQPVFELGGVLRIPSNEVLVGFSEDVTLEEATEFFEPLTSVHGLTDIRHVRANTFALTIDNPANGRAYAVSKALAKLEGLDYAEPNHVMVVLYGDQLKDDVKMAEDATSGKKPFLCERKSVKLLNPRPNVDRAGPTWTTIASMDFEDGSVATGWTTGVFTTQSSVDAYWGVTNYRSHGGTNSLYCAASGTQAVSGGYNAPAGMYAGMQSSALDLSGYEEVYIECWFYAVNELTTAGGVSLLAGSYITVYDSGWNGLSTKYLAVAYTGDCTQDPTTVNGWRRCLFRLPPAALQANVVVSFEYKSLNGTGSNEGVYIDDIRMVGTADVDTETGISNDTYGPRIYEYKNVGQVAGLGNDNNDLNIPEAWTQVTLSGDMIVAVIDSGVDLYHPDLNLTNGFNYDGTSGGGIVGEGTTWDGHHGTCCAGNAGAIGNNSAGVAGTAPGVKIMPIQNGSTDAQVATVFDLAVANGAKVLSNSWGGIGNYSATIESAIKSAMTNGAVVVFAAGNGPDRSPWEYTVAWPGSMSDTTDVICVGASSLTDEHKSASSSDGEFGWGSSYQGYNAPDVLAPGPWSYSTDVTGTYGYNDGSKLADDDYDPTFGGTSSSTPKVAGICALLLSADSTLTPSQVKTILRNTAHDVGDAGWDTKCGYGRVDAEAAVKSAAGGGTGDDDDDDDSGTGTATISLSTTTLTPSCKKGQDASSQTFTVDNSGTGTLSYTISDDQTWLSCSPTSGSITKTRNSSFSRGERYRGEIPMVKVMRSGLKSDLRIMPDAAFKLRADTATINVSYDGFTAEQEAAFEYAKDIWEKSISSSVTINVDAKWDKLGDGILGQAGAAEWFRNFTGGERDTYYPVALAEALAGTDLSTESAYEILTWYNTDYADLYYFGTDGNCPTDKIDYATVVLHELCHGLGFAGLTNVQGGAGYYGGGTDTPSVYGTHIIGADGSKMVDTYTNGSAALASFLTSGAVYWKGTNAGTIELFAPSPFMSGSSISHVAESYNGTSNALMTYAASDGEVNHSIGTVVPNMFKDMGWTVDGGGGGGGTGDTITVTYDTDALAAGTHTATITITGTNATNSPQTIAVTLTVTNSGQTVSIGSLFDVDAADCVESRIDEFDKAPKVFAVVGGRPKRAKVTDKGNTFPLDTVTCEWSAAVDAGTYSLYVQPKGYDAEEVSEDFEVADPTITGGTYEVESTKLTRKGTLCDVSLIVNGTYFGTKKPKLYFIDDDFGKKKGIKVISYSFETDADGDGTSSVTAYGKKLPATSGTLYLENKIGVTGIDMDLSDYEEWGSNGE